MRPEILNPIFAEIAALKGVGPALARPLKRLELERVADVLFHLPVTRIDRKTVAELDAGDAGRIVNIVLTPVEYRTGGPRSPFRVQVVRSEEHTSELQSLMRISYAVFCLKKKKQNTNYAQIQSNKIIQLHTNI